MCKTVLYLKYYLMVMVVIAVDVNATEMASENLQKNSIASNLELIDSSRGAWWYGEIAKNNYEIENYNEAITNFSFAIILDPEVPEFYHYRGNSFALSNQLDKAFADYKKAIELEPEYFSDIKSKGWEYLKSFEFSKAYHHYVNYLKMIPKDPKLFFGIGVNSGYIKILNNLAWEAVRNNERPKAIQYFTSNLKLSPNDPDAYLGMAVIYYTYGDFENASLYLNQAKSSEPSLYQGFTGIVTLEKAGYSFNEKDKEIINKMFLEITDKMDDMQKLTTLGTWKFLVGFMYIFLGIIAFFIFVIRIKRLEGFIFYLGLLNISFGLKFLNDNPLIQLTELPSPYFWEYGMPLVAFVIPVAFILFIRYFIGWGWKRSILWLLIFSILQGVIKIISEYSQPAQDVYGTTNTIFGFLAIMVLFFHLFLPEMRKSRELQIIGAGLGLYLLAIFYDNLAIIKWLPANFSFDNPAYMVFNACLIYVAFLRITTTEKEYLAVKQDLETARSIQNAILPEANPKGFGYEVSTAYVPMALIGGDYYDYQMGDESHIGLLIADVSGHGISAALIASMLKVAFASQINNARNPALVLDQINLSLNGKLNNEFITAGYIGIDLHNKELTYSSAGHPPMLMYRRKNNEMNEIKVIGIPLGVMPETNYIETKMQLITGDRLILYTDGITDVFNLGGEAMGKSRFIELIKDTKNLLADDTVESILNSINKWSGKKEMESHDDDITLIVFDVL